MSVSRWLIMVSATALIVPLNVSCVQIDCGEGTVERDGTCVPADSQPGAANCGPKTHLEGQICVPDGEVRECGPGTTEDIDEETGVISCVGDGSSQGCDGSFACPGPVGTSITLCGQMIDIETSQPLTGGATGSECPTSGGTGACNLDVKFYDAIEFVTDPQGADPLVLGTALFVDDCGRFRAKDIPYPNSTFLGMGIDDKSGNQVALSGVALGPAQGETIESFEAYVMSQATNTKWTGMLDLGGQTIEDAGAYVTIFRTGADGDLPVDGVTFTNATGGTYPNDDYYFDDVDPLTRAEISPDKTATGPNGTSILLNRVSLTQYTGMGGIPDNCSFVPANGAVIPHVIATATKEAFVGGNEEQPCPAR